MALKFDDGAPYIDLGNGVRIALDLDSYDADKTALDKASQELRESPETIEAGLRELRDLLKADPDLAIPVDDDAFLKKFLRPTKYYAQSAYEMIKGFYKYKANAKFVIDDLSIERIRVALEERVVQLMPERDQHGRRVLFLEMGSKWDYTKVPYPELVRAAQGLLALLVLEPRTQLHGVVFICNFEKFTMGHLAQFTPQFAKITIDYSQKYAPMRVKGINVINNSDIFGVLFNIFKPFLGKKWKQRIHFHGNKMESLHKIIDADRLPPGLGGTLDVPEVDGKVMSDFIQEHRSLLEEHNSRGYKNVTS